MNSFMYFPDLYEVLKAAVSYRRISIATVTSLTGGIMGSVVLE